MSDAMTDAYRYADRSPSTCWCKICEDIKPGLLSLCDECRGYVIKYVDTHPKYKKIKGEV